MLVQAVRAGDLRVVRAVESGVVGEGVDLDGGARVGHLVEDGLGDEGVEHGAHWVPLAGAHGVEHLDRVAKAGVFQQDDARDAVDHADVVTELGELCVDELPDRVPVEVLERFARVARDE